MVCFFSSSNALFNEGNWDKLLLTIILTSKEAGQWNI